MVLRVRAGPPGWRLLVKGGGDARACGPPAGSAQHAAAQAALSAGRHGAWPHLDTMLHSGELPNREDAV